MICCIQLIYEKNVKAQNVDNQCFQEKRNYDEKAKRLLQNFVIMIRFFLLHKIIFSYLRLFKFEAKFHPVVLAESFLSLVVFQLGSKANH